MDLRLAANRRVLDERGLVPRLLTCLGTYDRATALADLLAGVTSGWSRCRWRWPSRSHPA